jgi:hypothetical protein
MSFSSDFRRICRILFNIFQSIEQKPSEILQRSSVLESKVRDQGLEEDHRIKTAAFCDEYSSRARERASAVLSIYRKRPALFRIRIYYGLSAKVIETKLLSFL